MTKASQRVLTLFALLAASTIGCRAQSIMALKCSIAPEGNNPTVISLLIDKDRGTAIMSPNFHGHWRLSSISSQLIILKTQDVIPTSVIDAQHVTEGIQTILINIDRFTGDFLMSSPGNRYYAVWRGHCSAAVQRF